MFSIYYGLKLFLDELIQKDNLKNRLLITIHNNGFINEENYLL